MDKLRENEMIEELQTVQIKGDAPMTFTITFRWKPKEAAGV